jgi:hypothetical protein
VGSDNNVDRWGYPEHQEAQGMLRDLGVYKFCMDDL